MKHNAILKKALQMQSNSVALDHVKNTTSSDQSPQLPTPSSKILVFITVKSPIRPKQSGIGILMGQENFKTLQRCFAFLADEPRQVQLWPRSL